MHPRPAGPARAAQVEGPGKLETEIAGLTVKHDFKSLSIPRLQGEMDLGWFAMIWDCLRMIRVFWRSRLLCVEIKSSARLNSRHLNSWQPWNFGRQIVSRTSWWVQISRQDTSRHREYCRRLQAQGVLIGWKDVAWWIERQSQFRGFAVAEWRSLHRGKTWWGRSCGGMGCDQLERKTGLGCGSTSWLHCTPVSVSSPFIRLQTSWKVWFTSTSTYFIWRQV